MDFSFSEEQEAVRELAARIFSDLSTPERLREIEETDERFDRKLWAELASAGLLGIWLPEAVGGADLGFVAAGIVAEEAGRTAAAVPYVASAVLGAGPIARFGDAEQQQRWLAPLVAGDVVLTAALVEQGGDPWPPLTRRRARQGDGWRIDGTKSFVPAGMVAGAVVVSARTDDGIGLFVVDPTLPGVSSPAPRRPPAGRSRPKSSWLESSSGPATCSSPGRRGSRRCGGCSSAPRPPSACRSPARDAAVKLTASYTSERVQFDKVIATFQAVGQRAADAFIDAEGVRLTAWQAAWRLSEGRPAATEVAIAKFWADDGAQRVVHACQHLHGGVGVDRDYPLHRYYLLTKHLALTLGGATTSLLRLGDLLADEPA